MHINVRKSHNTNAVFLLHVSAILIAILREVYHEYSGRILQIFETFVNQCTYVSNKVSTIHCFVKTYFVIFVVVNIRH